MKVITAESKICPFSLNRQNKEYGRESYCYCHGDSCMAWVWDFELEERAGISCYKKDDKGQYIASITNGRCSLIPAPGV